MEKNNLHNEQPENGNLLGSIPKREFQEAPAGYFDALPEEIMNRIQSAPAFYALEKRETSHELPETYAQDLHDRVMGAIGGQQKETKIVSMPLRIMRWTAVAATLALLFTVGYNVLNQQQAQPANDGSMANVSAVTTDDYQHYLENEINIDDAIAYYVSEQVTDQAQAEHSAELDYLLAEEEIEFENY